MQFHRKIRRSVKLTGERKIEFYPHALQFYKIPPTDTVSLEEFEKLALDRLQVLRIVERAGAKYSKSDSVYRETIVNDLRKQNLSYFYKVTVDEEHLTDIIYDERRKDHISHFILRLAYCRREDLRRWFLTQEVDLFRIRFISEQTKFRKLFMELNHLDYNPIDEQEKDRLMGNLTHGIINSAVKVKKTNFYKVPFTEVLDLVRNRKVYLQKGYAFIPENDLVSIVVSAYRAHLSHSLALTSKALPQLEEDSRLISMLSTLHQRYIGTDYSSKKVDYTGEVTPEMVDSISKPSFPLCMLNLHETLRKNHHLKYNGRLQYGLFLKGIGMSLEDAFRFWRSEFTKVMDMDKFDKQYAYNIRYNYGKEGKRVNFSPYSCMKIIVSNTPGPGEFHGCPYKHSDKDNLRQKLQSLQISGAGTNSIMDLVGKGHYQVACLRYFELMHNEITVEQGINHPNQYFEESQKIKKGLRTDEKTASQVPTTRAVVYEPADNKASTETEDMEMDFDIPISDIEDFIKTQ